MAEGFKNFAAGAVLGETDLDDYLMSQTAMRFATAAARDSALASVLTEGLISYLKDSDSYEVYSGSAWAAGWTIGSWLTYTPTMFQEDGTGQTLTIHKARYTRIGRTVIGTVVVTIAGAGSATNGESVIVSMPITPAETSLNADVLGNGFFLDTSATTTYPIAVVNYAGAFRFHRTDTAWTLPYGIDPNISVAIGDKVSFSFTYEAVS